jgi:ABC-type histidine transport system ATPase subunit
MNRSWITVTMLDSLDESFIELVQLSRGGHISKAMDFLKKMGCITFVDAIPIRYAAAENTRFKRPYSR